MIRCLSEDFTVHVVALGRGNIPDIFFEPLPQSPRTIVNRIIRILRLAARRHDALVWTPALRDLARRHRALDHAIISVHDLVLLPIALAMRDTGRVLFDAREYYPRHFENYWWWRALHGPLNTKLCRHHLPLADHVVTVSQGLADAYLKNFGVRCHLLPSMPEAADLHPGPVDPASIRMIHHGNASPNRRIELMIDLMRLLPPHFTLDLMLVGMDSAYGRSLHRRARGLANVVFRDPVPLAKIIPVSNAYDVGIFLCPPTTFNLRHALPNKFFEFIQARLALAIGPSIEMAPYVHRHGCGIVADDFTPANLAEKLAALTPSDISRMKAASHQAALELHAENGRKRINRIIRIEAGVNAIPE